MFESIRLQTIPPNQVIFVIDQSPDNTLQILQDLVNQYSAEMSAQLIILENEENLGQAASLNKAIEYSDTDLIMILNDDDYLLHDSIEVALSLLKKYPNAALLGGHALHFGGDQLKSIPRLIQSICPIDDIEIDLRYPEQVSTYQKYNDINMTHSGSCFFKSAWKVIGGYYPDKTQRLVHFSDRDFQLRMNALFPVALSNMTPLSCWRNDSSVDQGVNS
jgi:GT2 family glycosyltransferase